LRIKHSIHFLKSFLNLCHIAQTKADGDNIKVIPQAGKKLFQEKDAYQYLVESIRAFPNQEKLAAMIRDAGFKNVSYRNFCGGIAAIHSGWRLE
jgi:demethylmenaquinone methyltransferase/2-methoxy-6-polyprenyl-1,4-benzoquinol methylase